MDSWLQLVAMYSGGYNAHNECREFTLENPGFFKGLYSYVACIQKPVIFSMNKISYQIAKVHLHV